MGDHFLHDQRLHSEEPIENILRQLESLRSHNIGDVKIVCRDGTLVAHKIILATISELFQREFSHNFRDETISVIAPDIDRNDVSKCLDTLYNRREVSRDETFIKLICGHLPSVAQQTDGDILEETKMEEVEKDVDDWEDCYDYEELKDEGEVEEVEDEPVEQPRTNQTANTEVGPSNVRQKKKGVRRSIVWKHFVRVSQERYFSTNSCLHCGAQMKSHGGNTIKMLTHLKRHHPGYESFDSVEGQGQDYKTGTPTIIKFTAQNSSSVKDEDQEENIDYSDPDISDAEDEDDDDFDFIESKKKAISSRKSHFRSLIWLHFRRNEEDHYEAMCNRCGQIINMPGGSNTHLFRHLKKYHLGRDNDILKHFYEGSSKTTSTCIHCGHVVKRKTDNDFTQLHGLVSHMTTMHEDIFDRNELMLSKGINQEKMEQLTVVEPKFDNFEDARKHFKFLSDEQFAKKKPEEKKEKEKNYAWQYFIRQPREKGTKKDGTAVCQLCNKSYSAQVINLKRHLVQEHQILDQEPYQYFNRQPRELARLGTAVCKLCDKICTANSTKLQRHLVKAHQIFDPERGPESHVCSHCGKGFDIASDLWKHEKTHEVKVRIPCTLCEKTFEQPIGLKRHMKTHTGERPYQE